MVTNFVITLLCFLLPTLMILLVVATGKKSKTQHEKNTPFECGFNPLNKARMPFSLRFFLICIIFLIFDVEITVIFPLAILLDTFSTAGILLPTLIILMIVILGLIYEWKEGTLNWTV